MGMGSIWHWVVVLVIVLLIFGTKKLRNIGEDLGGAVRGFKDGMKSEEQKPEAQKQVNHAQPEQVIDGEVTEKTKS